MIPSSAFAFFAFLLIVIPGFAFTLSRGRYKPTIRESVLQETGRVLSSSLISNLIAGLALFGWWSPPVRNLVNGTPQDLFKAYLEALTHLTAVSLASSALAFAMGEIYYRLSGARQSQQSVSVLDNAFTLGKGKSSIAFIALTDGTQIAGQVTRYDNAPEASQHFMEIASPYWIGNLEDRKGATMDDAKLIIPISLVKTLQLQSFDPHETSLPELIQDLPRPRQAEPDENVQTKVNF